MNTILIDNDMEITIIVIQRYRPELTLPSCIRFEVKKDAKRAIV